MPHEPLPLERRTELRDLIDDDLLATLTRTSNSLDLDRLSVAEDAA